MDAPTTALKISFIPHSEKECAKSTNTLSTSKENYHKTKTSASNNLKTSSLPNLSPSPIKNMTINLTSSKTPDPKPKTSLKVFLPLFSHQNRSRQSFPKLWRLCRSCEKWHRRWYLRYWRNSFQEHSGVLQKLQKEKRKKEKRWWRGFKWGGIGNDWGKWRDSIKIK